MGGVHRASLPRDHLVAEVVAVPLASEEAFARGLTDLDPELRDATGDLWAAVEPRLLGSFPDLSIDHLIAIRDRLWFHPELPGGSVALASYLRTLVNGSLTKVGGRVVPRPLASRPRGSQRRRPNELLGRRLWRWLTFALPPDLILGGLAGGPLGVGVALMQKGLEQSLADEGFAETHLHLGAGLDHSLLWVAAQLGLAVGETGADGFKSPSGVFDHGRYLGSWVLRAALARFLLARHLRWWLSSRSEGDERATSRFTQTALRHVGRLEVPGFERALGELACGQLLRTPGDRGRDLVFSELSAYFRRLSGITRSRIPEDLDGLLRFDPIGVFFPSGAKEGPSTESRFVSAALDYLAQRQDDAGFAVLFWQVIRVRCLLYRHLVQRPMTPGLQWFVRTYRRIAPARRVVSYRAMVESAARTCGLGNGLRSLEIRTSPHQYRSRLLKFVDACDRAFRRLRAGDENLEFGIVFHLTRRRGGGMEEGRPKAHWHGSSADPEESGYRYGRFFARKRREVTSLTWLLKAFPRSLRVVRGFDVCTDELGVPSWVLVPLLSELRYQSGVAVESLSSRPGGGVPPLRLTAHAGEDFVHLLGGLRRVDEAVEYFGLREGDRVGHALALGVDASAWARSVGHLAVMKEERLLDLAWEWTWYQQAEICDRPRRLSFLNHEIRHLAKEIFDKPLTPFKVAKLVEDLHKPDKLKEAGYPRLADPVWEPGRGDELQLLTSYLCSRRTFRKGRETIWVDPAAEVEVLEDLQAGLRKKVAARGLTVEINPSSNLLIGNLADLRSHPLWRLHPPVETEAGEPIAVCVGSDDPATFATTLRGEYGLLYDTLVSGGLSSDQARQWLNRARVNGLESRFTIRTRHAPPPRDPLEDDRAGIRWEPYFDARPSQSVVPRTELHHARRF